MYERKILAIGHEWSVNCCPHCETKFVVLVEWDKHLIEQVGPTMYCYMCGKKFNENTNNKNPK